MEMLIIVKLVIIEKELFTPDSLTTLVGLTGMVYVASNSIQRAFNYNPKWLGLIIAEILTLIAVYISFENPSVVNYFIAVFNGFLVYLTSAGATSMGDTITTKDTKHLETLGNKYQKRKFTSSWW